MAITFVKEDKVILITSPQTTVTIQDLINAIRPYEASEFGIDIGKIADAFGKQDLGGGVLVGITLVLLNDWRIQFEDRAGPDTVQVSVEGGNIVAENIYDNNPIKASTFTQVTITSSASATISQLEIVNLKFLIESLRDSHRVFGDIYYWDPVNGDDNKNGTSPDLAVQSFSVAHGLVTDWNNDVIVAVASDTTGVTTVDDELTITKNSLSVRGPGVGFKIFPTVRTQEIVKIAADQVEFSGFILECIGTGSFDSIRVTGSNDALIQNVTVQKSAQNGISLIDTTGSVVQNCNVDLAGSDGILLSGTTATVVLKDNFIDRSADHGIHICGTVAHSPEITNNQITLNNKWGLQIDSATEFARIRSSNFITNNGLGNLQDQGVSSSIESLRIDRLSFNDGAVWVDSVLGITGTEFPRGTPEQPVNNFEDAYAIASFNSLNKYRILRGNYALSDSLGDLRWTASVFENNGPHQASLTFVSGVNYDLSVFENVSMHGTISGSIKAVACHIHQVDGLAGDLDHCLFEDVIRPASSGTFNALSCYSGIAGLGAPTIDLDGVPSSIDLNIRDYNGGLRIINRTVDGLATLDVNSGFIRFDSSNVSGTFVVRGVGKIIQNDSGPGCTINSSSLVNPESVAQEIWNSQTASFVSPGGISTFGGVIASPTGSQGGIFQTVCDISASLTDHRDEVEGGNLVAAMSASVWDAASGSHNTSGTMGWLQNEIAGLSTPTVDPTSVRDAVWNAPSASYNAANTMGRIQNQMLEVSASVDFIRDIEGGRWKIDTALNQMIFYKEDNVTEVARFDLKDASGAAASDDVFERTKA